MSNPITPYSVIYWVSTYDVYMGMYIHRIFGTSDQDIRTGVRHSFVSGKPMYMPNIRCMSKPK